MLDFGYRMEFWIQGNTTFRKLDLFSSSGEVGRHLLCWVPWKELTSITGKPMSHTWCEELVLLIRFAQENYPLQLYHSSTLSVCTAIFGCIFFCFLPWTHPLHVIKYLGWCGLKISNFHLLNESWWATETIQFLHGITTLLTRTNIKHKINLAHTSSNYFYDRVRFLFGDSAILIPSLLHQQSVIAISEH
jgi:hypothetical protein